MGLRHGGRGHQVSRKTVRQRRRAGIKPRRGHNFDPRLRNERRITQQVAETNKVYLPEQTTINALLGALSVTGQIREDVEQELWVRLLEGDAPTLNTARTALAAAREVFNGIALSIPIDTPLTALKPHNSGGGVITYADMLDQNGLLNGREPRWTPRMARSWCPCPRCGGRKSITSFVCRDCYQIVGQTRSANAKALWWKTHRGEQLPEVWPTPAQFRDLTGMEPLHQLIAA